MKKMDAKEVDEDEWGSGYGWCGGNRKKGVSKTEK